MFFFIFLWLAVPGEALEITTDELSVAIVGRRYAPEPLVVQGGGACTENGVSVQVVSGGLPPGIHLSAAGYFAGTPRREGSYTFTVQAVNSCQRTSRTYTLRVDGAPILIASEESLDFVYVAGSRPPAPQTLHVAASRRDLPYNCEAEGAAWLDWRPVRGRTPMDGSPFQGDPVDVSVNPGQLAPGQYRTVLRCTAWQVLRDVLVTVSLTVQPAPAP